MSMGGVKEVTAMWLSPKQVRALTGLERHEVDWWRKSGKVQARKWQRMWLYNVADVYRISEQYYRATLTFEGAQLANLIEELRADE
jgi:hypothetical protein